MCTVTSVGEDVVSRGTVSFVGEVSAEDSVGTTAGVACLVENVVKDVGDVEGLVGVCDPHSEEGAWANEGSLVRLMDRVPNRV